MQIVRIFFGCRWRDVKLRAFESEKHRTYVDLKVSVLSDNCLVEAKNGMVYNIVAI